MRLSITCLALLLLVTPAVRAQERGATRLHALVNGLTVTPRVLVIGARPTDADADLIARLALGAHVQTAYLSLTRGESAPNYAGLETGATLGAVRVQEMLAARRIDGGEQYFTRAFDFGSARNAAEGFGRWDHANLLGDVVSVVRGFRPHVIISLFRPDTADHDGQHQVSAVIAREVFDAAADTMRYAKGKYGMPWSPASMFEPGLGATIDSREYDHILGRTYADVATESRAQLRSFGFLMPPWQAAQTMEWRRVATHAADSAASGATSIFAGIDTSLARMQKDVPANGARPLVQLSTMLAYADSARTNLDLRNPSRILPYLRQVHELASAARGGVLGCRHPSRDAAMSFVTHRQCDQRWLDLDASLDLILRRSAEALLVASGITFELLSDREFLAGGDTSTVTITIANNSDSAITVNDVSVSGAIPIRMTEPVRVPAHMSTNVTRSIINIAYAHPWWIFRRKDNFYPPSTSALDGVPRPGVMMQEFGIGSSAIAESMRRMSDVTATMTVGGTTVTSSIGEVAFKTAEPAFGMRNRALSGVSAVTLDFERALEWAQAGKPLKKQLRVTLKSYSDRPQRITLKQKLPVGIVRLDSLPPAITLAPHEAVDVTIPVRGTPEAVRYDLGLFGIAPADTFEVGFRTAQYSYLPPLHLFRESSVSIQSVDIVIPNRLSVAYVRGAGDDADAPLKQLGIPTYVLNNEGLTRFDIEGLSTVVIGPDAFRVDHGLFTQMPRLTEFARTGGTVVVLSNPVAVSQPGILPFPVDFARPYMEQVTREDAPVSTIDGKARVLTWPNVIRADDWSGWVGARALTVPTTVDARYALVVETHDPEQKQNRNGILVATVGKGRIIYTSLTLTQQIANAVPGAMRLFVNLLSAGLPVEAKAK
ncbi:MAG: LmbE family protein [Gemmatimonadetes bacterium]|nr:LmbE family protein [Gemmatimonadota bacterium]